MPICLGVLAGGIAFVTNWLALIPWRRAKNLHWTERARVFFPALTAARINLWAIPAVLTMMALLLYPDSGLWLLTFFITAAGAVAGTLPMNREICARVSLRYLARQTIISWFLRSVIWFVFLSAVVLMPNEFNWTSLFIFLGVAALWILWNRDGWILAGQFLRLYVSAPTRLEKIVQDTSGKIGVIVRKILVMRSQFAQAYALPQTRTLIFTERILELLSDEELATVCAHEIAHLTESRRDYYARYIIIFNYLPWLLFKPLTHSIGFFGFYLPLLNMVVTPRLYRRVSRRLEERADKIAKNSELNEGIYARTLASLHEDNLVPAVVARRHSTHPHLYDRLIAAGVTPDFPRPPAAAAMAWHGWLFSMLTGILAAILVLRMTGA